MTRTYDIKTKHDTNHVGSKLLKVVAVGTKLLLYRLVLHLSIFISRPDGRKWNSQCKVWEMSFKVDLDIICTCQENRDFRFNCNFPISSSLFHFTIWFRHFLFLSDRLQNQATKQKDKTDSIKARWNRVSSVLSIAKDDSFLRQCRRGFPFSYTASIVWLKSQFTVNSGVKECICFDTYVKNKQERWQSTSLQGASVRAGLIRREWHSLSLFELCLLWNLKSNPCVCSLSPENV